MATRLLALVLALLVAGCAAPTPQAGAVWAEAAGSHPGALSLQASALDVEGIRALGDAREVRLLPRTLPPGNAEWMPGGAPPTSLAIRNATVEGVRGTLVATFGEGVTLAALLGSFGDVPLRLDALGHEDALVPPFGADVLLDPRDGTTPFPPGLASDGSFLANGHLDLPLPARMSVSAERLLLHPADGGAAIDLGTSATVDEPRDVTAFGGRGLRIGLTKETLSWEGKLGVEAHGVAGRATLEGAEHEIRGRVFAALDGSGTLTYSRDGDVRTLSTSGSFLRLADASGDHVAATAAALPEVLEVRALAGKAARFAITLVETSGGAYAMPRGYELVRAEGAPSETALPRLELARADPLPITRELLSLANRTAEDGLIGVPALLAIGIAAPFIGIAESIASIASAFSEPRLDAVTPREAQRAEFVVEMPAIEQTTELVIRFANAPDVRIRLDLVPEGV